MSCSKPLPPFNFDVLYYLNRDQLERFSIVCRPLKNYIDRYFKSKPYRVFHDLYIRGGSYALVHNLVQWHPNRDDYSVQQFLADKKGSIDKVHFCLDPIREATYYSFAEMRPYLGPTVRIKSWTTICVGGDSTYNPEHIAEMESVAYLWRDGEIDIKNAEHDIIVAEDFQPILNSPTILQCRDLHMYDAYFSYKDYKVLYTVNSIHLHYDNPIGIDEMNPDYWVQFLEQPGVKPLVLLCELERECIDNVLYHLAKAFSSSVSPNAFKIVFAELDGEVLTEFQETNKSSGEIFKLKKGLPVECQNGYLKRYDNYTLERSSI